MTGSSVVVVATAAPVLGTRLGSHKRNRSITLDNIKTLHEKRTRCEQGILKLSGAARQAEDQFRQVITGGACTLCQATHTSVSVAEERMRRTLSLCETSVNMYMTRHSDTIGELALLTGKSQTESCQDKMHSDEWCSYEFKKGKIATLREQKAQSLTNQECVVCGSGVVNFSDFLRSVDRQICALEAELHVHQAMTPGERRKGTNQAHGGCARTRRAE